MHVDAEALAYPLEGTGRFRIDDAEERFARSLPGESQARDRRTDQRREGELLGPRRRDIAMPCGLLVGVAALADVLAEKGTSGAEFDWSLALLPAPLGLVVGFLLVFLVGYGLKGLLSIAKYKPAALAADTALEQVAQALPQR